MSAKKRTPASPVENLSRLRRGVGRCRAQSGDAPFYHLVFDRVFPDDVYAAMLARDAGCVRLPPDVRPRQGQRPGGRHPHAGEDRPVPRIHPPPAAGETRGLGRRRCARCARRRSSTRSCAGSRRDCRRRFGADFAKVGMYPVPILTRDIPGYRITPHPDTQWKGITVQLYLPRDDVDDAHRHDLPRAAARRQHAEAQADEVRAEYRLCLRGRQGNLAFGRSGRHRK